MVKRLRWQALGVVLGGLMACASPVSPRELLSVEQGERLWGARGYEDYSFEVRNECFCPPSLRDWARVEVIGGQVERVLLLTTVAEVTEERLQWWRTIEELFGDLRQANEEGGSWLEDVRFTLDPAFGFPTVIHWIAKPGLQDAGVILHLRNPRSLDPPPG